MFSRLRVVPGHEERFALLRSDSEQLALLLAAGWQVVAEQEDGKRVLAWWPCQCDPPIIDKRISSPAPPDRGEND